MSIIQRCASYFPSFVGMGFGAKETIQGSSDISEGKILQGIKKVFVGLTATNLGARCSGLTDKSLQNLMKGFLALGAATGMVNGFVNLLDGIRRKKFTQILKGTAVVATGAFALQYVQSLDPELLLMMHQAAGLALASFWVSKSGLNDLKKGKYKIGVFKILLGVGGGASFLYYASSRISQNNFDFKHSDVLDLKQSQFMKKHQEEIEYIYETHQTTGNWTKLGEGVSKAAYTHPELPDHLIKIPTLKDSFWGHAENDVHAHYRHLQEAQKLARNLKLQHIHIPKCSFIEGRSGPFLMEEKLDCATSWAYKSDVLKEFDNFIEESGLCDVRLAGNHNACFLNGTAKTPKIGVFDFDCKTAPESSLVVNGAMFQLLTKATKMEKGTLQAKVVLIAGVAAGVFTTMNVAFSTPENMLLEVEKIANLSASYALLGGAVGLVFSILFIPKVAV